MNRSSKLYLALLLLLPMLLLQVLVVVVVNVDAWIAQARYVDYAPNTKSYLFNINPNYMSSSQQVNGLRIWISNWYILKAYDQLGTDASHFAFAKSYDSDTGVLICNGIGTVTQMAGILRWAWFYTTSWTKRWRMFHWNLGYDYHFYLWTYKWWLWRNAPSATWNAAKQDCESLTFLGNRGFLGNMESWYHWYFPYIFSRNKTQWVGGFEDPTANDDEGNTWRWVTGPYKKYDDGKGLPFYGRECSTTAVSTSSYDAFLFPAWYQNMFNGTNPMPLSWKSFWKTCLNHFGDPFYCPNTPIATITSCQNRCRYWCRFATGSPSQQPPSSKISVPDFDPHFKRICTKTRPKLVQQFYPDSKVVDLNATDTLPIYNASAEISSGSHYLQMTNDARWRNVPNDDTSVDGYWCQFLGTTPPYYENGFTYSKPGCAFNTNMNSCNMETARCRWFVNNNSCELINCQLYNSPHQCRQFPGVCEWNTDPRQRNTCVRKYCPNAWTSSSRCNRDRYCSWMTVDGIPQCGKRMCSLYTDPCSCYRYPDASWEFGDVVASANCFWDPNFNMSSGFSSSTTTTNSSNSTTISFGKCVDIYYAACLAFDFIFAFQTPRFNNDILVLISALEAIRRQYDRFPLSYHSWSSNSYDAKWTDGWRLAFFVYGYSNGSILSYTNGSVVNTRTSINDNPVSPYLTNQFTSNVTEIWNAINWVEDILVDSGSIFLSPKIAKPLEIMIGIFQKFTLGVGGNNNNEPVRNAAIFVITTADSYADNAFLTENLRNLFTQNNVKLIAARLGTTTPPSYPLCNVIPAGTTCSMSMAWLPNPGGFEYFIRHLCFEKASKFARALTYNNSIGISSDTATNRGGLCYMKTNETLCNDDSLCSWSDGDPLRNIPNPYCAPSTCMRHYCTNRTCARNPACSWNSETNMCESFVCPSYYNYSQCSALPNKQCIYDIIPTTNSSSSSEKWYCRKARCISRTKYYSCMRDEYGCVWDTLSKPTGTCREKFYCHLLDSEVSCKMKSECLWETRFFGGSSSPSCVENTCSLYNSGYDQENGLALAAICQRNSSCQIFITNQTNENLQGNFTSTCTLNWCGSYSDVSQCVNDTQCRWISVPDDSSSSSSSFVPTCNHTVCSQFKDNVSCTNAANERFCMWNTSAIDTYKLATASIGGDYFGVCMDSICWTDSSSMTATESNENRTLSHSISVSNSESNENNSTTVSSGRTLTKSNTTTNNNTNTNTTTNTNEKVVATSRTATIILNNNETIINPIIIPTNTASTTTTTTRTRTTSISNTDNIPTNTTNSSSSTSLTENVHNIISPHIHEVVGPMSTTTAVIATLAQVPPVGVMSVRSSAIMASIACGSQQEELDRAVNPTQMSIGESEYRYWFGVVIGGLIIFAVSLFIAYFVFLFLRWRRFFKSGKELDDEGFAKIVNRVTEKIGTILWINSPSLITAVVATLAYATETSSRDVAFGLNLPVGLVFSFITIILGCFSSIKLLREPADGVVVTQQQQVVDSGNLNEKHSSPESDLEVLLMSLDEEEEEDQQNQYLLETSSTSVSPQKQKKKNQEKEEEKEEGRKQQQQHCCSSPNNFFDYVFGSWRGVNWSDPEPGSYLFYTQFLYTHSDSPKFVLVEQLSGAVIAIVSGLMQTPTASVAFCKACSIVVCFSHLPPLIFILVKRPIIARFDLVVMLTLWLGSTLAALIIVLSFYNSLGDNAQKVLEAIYSTTAGLSLLASVLAVSRLFAIHWREHVEKQKKRNMKASSTSSRMNNNNILGVNNNQPRAEAVQFDFLANLQGDDDIGMELEDIWNGIDNNTSSNDNNNNKNNNNQEKEDIWNSIDDNTNNNSSDNNNQGNEDVWNDIDNSTNNNTNNQEADEDIVLPPPPSSASASVKKEEEAKKQQVQLDDEDDDLPADLDTKKNNKSSDAAATSKKTGAATNADIERRRRALSTFLPPTK